MQAVNTLLANAMNRGVPLDDLVKLINSAENYKTALHHDRRKREIAYGQQRTSPLASQPRDHPDLPRRLSHPQEQPTVDQQQKPRPVS